MSGIDEAAAAFSADMGGASVKPARVVNEATEAGDLDIADVFGSHEHENDVEAGGDEIPTDEEVAAREVEGRKKGTVEDEDPLYAEEEDPEADPKDNKNVEEEEDEEEDPDADPDTKDEEEVALDPDLKVTVTVDGKEQEVSLSEALEGYIRTETFHTRLSEINDVKKVLRDESGKLLEDRKQAIQMLNELEEDLTGLMPDEPDWDKLFADKPAEARGIQRQWEAYKGQLQTIRTKREQLRQDAQGREAQRIVTFAKDEREKFENMPENRHWLTDPKKKEKDLASMVRTAKSLGFTDDEIRGTLDSRMLAILLRASKYDRMTANKPKLAPRGVKPAKPGAGNGPTRVRTTHRGIGRAQQQLSRSGKVDDAAAVFAEIIKPRR